MIGLLPFSRNFSDLHFLKNNNPFPQIHKTQCGLLYLNGPGPKKPFWILFSITKRSRILLFCAWLKTVSPSSSIQYLESKQKKKWSHIWLKSRAKNNFPSSFWVLHHWKDENWIRKSDFFFLNQTSLIKTVFRKTRCSFVVYLSWVVGILPRSA